MLEELRDPPKAWTATSLGLKGGDTMPEEDIACLSKKSLKLLGKYCELKAVKLSKSFGQHFLQTTDMRFDIAAPSRPGRTPEPKHVGNDASVPVCCHHRCNTSPVSS